MIKHEFAAPGDAPYQTVRRQFFPPMVTRPKLSSDKLFVWDAVFLVGPCLLGDEWTGQEPDALDWPTSPEEGEEAENRRVKDVRAQAIVRGQRTGIQQALPPERPDRNSTSDRELIVAEQKLWNENQLALARIKRAADWLDDRFRNGVVRTYTKPVNRAVDPQNMPPSEWFCDDALNFRIRQGWYERRDENQPNAHAVYIFVNRADLDREIAALAHAPLKVADVDLSRLPPALRLAVDLALADPAVTSQGRKERRRKVSAAWDLLFPANSVSYIEAIATVLCQEPDLARVQREKDRAARR